MTERDIFLSALDLPPDARPDFVAGECGADEPLRRRVDALLAAHAAAERFLEQPAAAGADTFTARGPSDQPTGPHAPDGPDADRAGQVLAGRYKLVEAIGEGGMGTVWVARQTDPVKRTVAVKLIKPGMDSRAVLARFDAERQALALMDHPNIARVFDAGISGRDPFFVMELVKGVPITDYCDARRLTPRQRLELFVPVCQAIQHAHQKGVIHRDIKPSNVLVALYDDRPVPKVIDFGVAKATGTTLTDRTLMTGFGAVVGTPEYMSPEQASLNNLDIDTRSDVYSLGVLLYELLTGTTPVDRKALGQAALLEVLRVVREVEAPRPSDKLSTSAALPGIAANRGTEPGRLSKLMKGELDWVVLKALEKDRARRYDTANGLARDIQRYLADEIVEARPPSTGYRVRKFVRRHRGQVVAAGLVLVTLMTGVIGTTFGLLEAKKQERIALAEADAKEQARAEEAAQRAVAEGEKAKALAAAEEERKAKLEADIRRKEAETNLAFAKKANEILGSVFIGLDPRASYATVAELRSALRENLTRAVRLLEGSVVGAPLTDAAMRMTLGVALMNLGEATLAIPLFKRGMEIRKIELGDSHQYTLASMDFLATSYMHADKLDLALPLFEQTFQQSAATLGAGHPGTLTGPDKTSETLEKSALTEVVSGPLSTMNNLAMCYKAAGKLDLALPLLEQTFKQSTASKGADHPDTLTTADNVAQCYLATGKVDLALPLFEQTLARRTALGANRPDTLITMHNLAACYRAAGKLDQAVSLGERSLKLMTARMGADHPDTITNMNNLAHVYWLTRRLDRSIALYEEVARLQVRKLGRDHPDTVRTISNLGVNYKDAGRLAEAIPLLEESYQASKKYPVYRGVGIPLLDAYRKVGKVAEAGKQFDRVLADARQQHATGSPLLAGRLVPISWFLLEDRAFARAEPLLRESLAIYMKTQPTDWNTFDTQSMLGASLLGQKKYADAEPLLRSGYEGLKQREKAIPPQSRTRIPEALARLVELHTATNQPAEVAKWRAERATYPREAAPWPRAR